MEQKQECVLRLHPDRAGEILGRIAREWAHDRRATQSGAHNPENKWRTGCCYTIVRTHFGSSAVVWDLCEYIGSHDKGQRYSRVI
eukprot:6486285-Amphidinium_carterae.2